MYINIEKCRKQEVKDVTAWFEEEEHGTEGHNYYSVGL